jgi:WS/DGAT/MGAT family acyltransferase
MTNMASFGPHKGVDFEPLSAQDQLFLLSETDHTHMHVGAVLIFESGALAAVSRGVRFERIRAHIASRLGRVPRYRQRLSFYPLASRPHWVDDDRFDLGHHVRHLRLPQPGTEAQLKNLCSQLLSQRLDRNRPLWEIAVIEGLRGGRFAMVAKTHHCLVDGIGGVNLLSAILDPDPASACERAMPWSPKPPLSAADVLRFELSRRVEQSMRWGSRLRSWAQSPREMTGTLGERALGIGQFLGASLLPAPDCSFNQPIGAQRRFEWWSVGLDEVKAIKNRFEGTVNDVVLATVAGALRRFLLRRGERELSDLRALVPVNVRTADEAGALGNHVSAYFVSLPVTARDPVARFRLTAERMRAIKSSKQAIGARILSGAAVPLLSMLMRFADRVKAFNLIVTNVPGPPIPLYLAGSRLHGIFPLAPLFVNQGLGVALFSYAGRLYWGLNADRDVLADVVDFRKALAGEFADLLRASRSEKYELRAPGTGLRFPPLAKRTTRSAPAGETLSGPPLAAAPASSHPG